MKVYITYNGLDRKIDGPFSISGSLFDLRSIYKAIQEDLSKYRVDDDSWTSIDIDNWNPPLYDVALNWNKGGE